MNKKNIEIIDSSRPSLLKIKKDENNSNIKNSKEDLNKKNNEIDNIDEELVDDYNEDEIVVGIDLGTCNSCISIWKDKKLLVIEDENGNKTIPSIVSFYKGTTYIGHEAKKLLSINPKSTFYGIKRYIGRKYSDNEVQDDINRLSYKIGSDDANDNIFLADPNNKEKHWSPEQIISIILMRLKNMAENYLKVKIKKAVITVPAYFKDSQREATKDACTIAGLECVRLINEPTAAALAYGFNKRDKKTINLVVYDLGGGTIDVVLLEITQGLFKVIESIGNTHLGGEDFDNRIMDHCIKVFCKINNLDIEIIVKKILVQKTQALKSQSENAKKILSDKDSAVIIVNKFYEDIDLVVKLSRNEFELICKDLFFSCLRFAVSLLKNAQKTPDMIDEVILVGGATRMPRIKRDLSDYFGNVSKENSKELSKKSRKKINDTVNPDEVVSAGAAIQAYIMYHPDDPYSSEVTLTDAIPLSLGIEVMGEQFCGIIKRGTSIPCEKTKRFTTDTDYMKSITINVYEGERKLSKDNYLLGKFTLFDIDAAPRGIPQIEITICVDYNGIVIVSAVDKRKSSTKKTLRITNGKGRLTKQQIDNMIEESKFYEMKDKITTETSRFKFIIKERCKTIIQNIDDPSFNLNDEDKKDIRDDIKKIINWLSKNDNSELSEYKIIADNIKKNYPSLILQMIKSDSSIKCISKDSEGDGVTVFNTEDADNDIEDSVFEKMNTEGYLQGLTDNQKQEIINKRETLLSLCDNLRKSTKSLSLNLSDDEKKKINDGIDNMVMWSHIVEKVKSKDFDKKIEILNNLCNEIVSNKDNLFSDTIIDKNKQKLEIAKYDLEQLTFFLKTSIDQNLFILENLDLRILSLAVNSIIKWIIKNENDKNITYKDYKKKLRALNGLCTELYKKINKTTFNKNASNHLPKESIQTKNLKDSSKYQKNTLYSDNTEIISL